MGRKESLEAERLNMSRPLLFQRLYGSRSHSEPCHALGVRAPTAPHVPLEAPAPFIPLTFILTGPSSQSARFPLVTW